MSRNTSDKPNPNSPAAKAGILPGDHITEVAGRRVGNWEDFTLETVTKAERPDELKAVVAYIRTLK